MFYELYSIVSKSPKRTNEIVRIMKEKSAADLNEIIIF